MASKSSSTLTLALLLVLSQFLYSAQFGEARTVAGNVEALKALKDSVDVNSIQPGSCLSSWNFSADPCDSAFGKLFTCGLRCDGGRVTELTLDESGYNGTLPPDVGKQQNLCFKQYLKFAGKPKPPTVGSHLIDAGAQMLQSFTPVKKFQRKTDTDILMVIQHALLELKNSSTTGTDTSSNVIEWTFGELINNLKLLKSNLGSLFHAFDWDVPPNPDRLNMEEAFCLPLQKVMPQNASGFQKVMPQNAPGSGFEFNSMILLGSAHMN